MFRTSLPVRFGDVDYAQIVYFPRYLHFCHCAFEDFFASFGKSYRYVLEEEKLGWPAIKTEVVHHGPLQFGTTVDIDVVVANVGNTSATFAYELTESGRTVASARVTVVCVSMETFAPCPIPERYREYFARHRSVET